MEGREPTVKLRKETSDIREEIRGVIPNVEKEAEKDLEKWRKRREMKK